MLAEPVDGSSLSEDEFAQLADEIANDSPPRVFALVEEFGNRECADLYAWGVEVGERASVFTHDGQAVAHCSSALGAHKMFSMVRKLWLVWPTGTSHS